MSNIYTLVKRCSATAVGIVLSLAFSFAWAWPPTYGAEFEVSRPELGGYDFKKENPSLSPEKVQQMKLVEHVRERCLNSDCKVIEVRGKWDQDYRVEYTDGWWFKISYDPACVEITFKPSTLEILEQKKDLINDQIFKSAQQINLTVKNYDTSHFNMGIRSAFDDSAEQFLRFYVDYTNHPDLALGSLGYDINNAPPLSVLGEDQRMALHQVVDDFKAGKLTTIAQVARAIQDRVYTRSYRPEWGGIAHYQAVGLKYVNKTDLTQSDAPMELRSVWIQRSAEQFNLVSKLIERRISFLKTLKTPIVYSSSSRDSFSASELKTRFYIYAEEAGMKYEEFKSLIPTPVQTADLSTLFRPDAPIETRLSELENYWDLLDTSKYVRQHAVEVLAHPTLIGNPKAERLIQKLAASGESKPATPTPTIEKAKAKVGLLTRVRDLFRKTQEAPAAKLEPIKAESQEKNVYQEMLKNIQANRTNAGTAPECRAIFN